MTTLHYIGAILVFILISGIGVYAGKKVSSAKDFSSGGRKAGAGIVAGTIVGTLVGGSSTVGTAQLAYTYGLSAWWFTLGGGIGCLCLFLFFVKPLYNSGVSTLPQVFSREYGGGAAVSATLLTSIGSFLSIVAQVLAGVALVSTVSGFNPIVGVLITCVLMFIYVVFGGVWGAGYVGIAKTILLYVGVGGCGVLAFVLGGGSDAFFNNPLLPPDQYLNLFSRGVAIDLGAGVSLILGVLTTQAYIQAVISARSLNLSRAGVMVSAIIIPIIGIAGILVGMYMKLHYPDINSASALPRFVLDNVPDLLGGIIFATLLVAVVGTGAGVTLGISSMMCNDVYKVFINKDASDKAMLFVARGVIFLVVLLAGGFAYINVNEQILNFSYLSFALRGAVAFLPLCAALFLTGKIDKRSVVVAMIAAPIVVIFPKLFFIPDTIDALYVGLATSFVILCVGYFVKKLKNAKKLS